MTQVAEPPPIPTYYVADPDGRTVFASGRTAAGVVETYRLADGIWQRIARFSPQAVVGTVPYMVESRGRVFGLSNPLGTADLVEWTPDSGDTRNIYRDADADVDGRITDFGGANLLAVRTNAGFPQWHYLQPEHPLVGAHKSLRAAFPDSDVDVTSVTADGTEAVVRVHSDRNAGTYHLLNTGTRETRLLATSRPWLDGELLPPTQSLEIPARDLRLLTAYLTRPDEAGPLPTIVWLHDITGRGRATGEFNATVQLLASRGYAVLQVNYRGSRGFGSPHAIPVDDLDGRVVQRDIADATRWLIEANLAVPENICVAGAGYGAYAALKALATSTTLFRCGVGIDGLYDLPADEGPATLKPQYLLNPPVTLDLSDTRRTPTARASNIGAAVLLVGGDARTNAFAETLRGLDKAVEQLQQTDDPERTPASCSSSTITSPPPPMRQPRRSAPRCRPRKDVSSRPYARACALRWTPWTSHESARRPRCVEPFAM